MYTSVCDSLFRLISFLFNDDRNTNSTTYQQPYNWNRIQSSVVPIFDFVVLLSVIPGGTW